MNKGDLERIRHIKEYCEDIARAIKRFGANQEAFLTDIDYYKSVSMSIMQIGELSIGLSEGFKKATATQIEWQPLRGMRNLFAHTYAKMDRSIVWDVADTNIPILLKFCDKTIEQAQEK